MSRPRPASSARPGRRVVFAPAALLALAVAGCGGRPPAETRPAILLAVVDTLRADRVSFAGDGATLPEAGRRLAGPGVVFERAYAQAPWTLPSMASLLTGLDPGDLLDGEGRPVGIPPGVATLAERLQAAGYETAAAIANPTLHAGAGFARGFDRFEIVPYEQASLALDAREVNRRARDWLAARRPDGPPFFLWVHYLDPHDPWTAPGADPRRPPGLDCTGRTVGGDDVHSLYTGARELGRPELDLECLRADYDAEIRYADRHLGALLDALPAAWRGRTLYAFTSDHGEELLDHGGWKHGETLYEEQIRVPLVLRWDGRLEPGARVREPVRLLDLAPTVLAAAGLSDRALPGGDLRAPSAPRTVVSRHLGPGPLRLAAVRGGHKLILFDRHAPFAPAGRLEEILWRRDVERLQRLEVYDLEADPAERRPLPPEALPPGLDPRLLARHLDRSLRGNRLWLAGLPEGSVLRGRIEASGPAGAARLIFGGPGDRVEAEGAGWEIEVVGDALPRVVTFAEEPRILGAALGLEHAGRRAPVVLRDPAGRPVDAATTAAALLTERFPEMGPGPEARLWRRPAAPEAKRDAETRRRLESLGYAG